MGPPGPLELSALSFEHRVLSSAEGEIVGPGLAVEARAAVAAVGGVRPAEAGRRVAA